MRALERETADTLELIELAEAEGDEAMVKDGVAALSGLGGRRQEQRDREPAVRRGRWARCLRGNQCRVRRHGGAGLGGDSVCACIRAGRKRGGFKVEILDQSEGEQAGIKSVSLQITGPNAYGWLKTESGVHRLVRISPFDSAARRHTSFASVWVYPVVDDTIEIEINPADLKVDTFRASGAGGQHVNKTESAIRITHIPTGIIVACQTDRSQHRNRATAMNMLKARMYEMELQKREAASAATEAAKTDIGWGHQIRSYVLAPISW